SVYIQRALRRTLQLPKAQLDYGSITDITLHWSGLRDFAKGNALTRLHLPPRAYLTRSFTVMGIDRIVLHLRDPRSMIISWTHQVERDLKARGLPGGLLDCQADLPADYPDWELSAKMAWQVENQLPLFVDWTTRWLHLVETAPNFQAL